jgi:hypothetical protein
MLRICLEPLPAYFSLLVFFMPSSGDAENLPRSASRLLQLADDSHAAEIGDCGSFDSRKISIRNPELSLASPIITCNLSSISLPSSLHHFIFTLLHLHVTLSSHHRPLLFDTPYNIPFRKHKPKPKASQSETAITATAPVESPISESLSANQQASSSITVDLPSGEVPSKDQPTLESLPEDQQPAGEILKDPPAVENPSEDPPTMKGPSGDPKPAEDPMVIPPARELSTTPPRLESLSTGQSTTQVQAGDQQTSEGPTTNQQAEKAPENTPVCGRLTALS